MIDAGVLSGERTVSAAGYNLRLEEEYADIGLGQANAAVKDAITSYLRAPEYDGWTVVGNALCLNRPKIPLTSNWDALPALRNWDCL